MKKLLLLIVLLSPWLRAQTVSGSLTASDSGACSIANSCITLAVDQTQGAAGIALSGTFSATAQFEVSADKGVTWVAAAGTPPGSTTTATSATAAGTWRFAVSGLTHIRVRCSAYTSGTIVASIVASRQSAGLGGGGGGSGGTPGGSTTQTQFNDAGAFAGDSTFTFNKTTKALTVQSLITSGSGSNQIDVGSASGTTPGIVLCHAGDAASNAEPCYIGFSTSPADTLTHYLFPTSTATCLAISDSAPAADSANCVLDMTGTRTLSNKTFDNTNAFSGFVNFTNVAAPSSPTAGKVSAYADSTDLRFHDKNASGVIGTTVVADTGASNNFLTAISATGAISKAQPSFSNLSGSVAASQLPNPSSSTLGGIESYAAVSNQWINAISTSGVPSSTQPAFSNLSGSATGAQLPATAVQTNQANTYTTGAQSFAAATSLLLPAGNTNPTADGSVYYNNSAQTPGTGEHLGGSAISQFVPFLRVVCPTTLTDVTVSTILNPAATTETVFDVNCKINSLHLTAGKTLLVFAELQVVAPGASASTQDFRLKICQVSGCASGTVVNLYDPSSTDSAIAINTTRSVGVMFIVRCDTIGTSGTLDVGLLSKAGSASSGAANSVTQPVTVATNVDEYLSMSYASGNATTGNTAQLRQFWVAEMN